MPKKTAARHSSAQHRPQPKRKEVPVRAASSTEVGNDEEVIAEEKTETSKAGAPRTKPLTAATKTPARPTSATVKGSGASAKPGAQPTRALATSKRGVRPGQRAAARPGQRLAVGRQANLVTAEHYSYVLKDLRLIGILAFCAFAILVALTFILPHLLAY